MAGSCAWPSMGRSQGVFFFGGVQGRKEGGVKVVLLAWLVCLVGCLFVCLVVCLVVVVGGGGGGMASGKGMGSLKLLEFQAPGRTVSDGAGSSCEAYFTTSASQEMPSVAVKSLQDSK